MPDNLSICAQKDYQTSRDIAIKKADGRCWCCHRSKAEGKGLLLECHRILCDADKIIHIDSNADCQLKAGPKVTANDTCNLVMLCPACRDHVISLERRGRDGSDGGLYGWDAIEETQMRWYDIWDD